MNVRRTGGREQAGERFIDRQQIAVEGEDAEPDPGTSSGRNFVGSQESSGVGDGVGVGGDDQGESKDEGPGEDKTFEHSSPSALGRESVGWN